jgi:hypothetical protein
LAARIHALGVRAVSLQGPWGLGNPGVLAFVTCFEPACFYVRETCRRNRSRRGGLPHARAQASRRTRGIGGDATSASKAGVVNKRGGPALLVLVRAQFSPELTRFNRHPIPGCPIQRAGQFSKYPEPSGWRNGCHAAHRLRRLGKRPWLRKCGGTTVNRRSAPSALGNLFRRLIAHAQARRH